MKTKLTFLLSLTFLFLFSGSSVVFGDDLQDATDAKLDALARAVSIAGGISAVSVALSGGTKDGLSKIIGLSALKN